MPSFLARIPMDRIDDWLRAGMHASVYLLGAALLTFFLGKLLHRMRKLSAQLIRERGGPEELEWEKQSATIADIVRRSLLFVVWALALVLALKEFQLDVGPILAGAGVAGLAVGFAAQSILKDWISGFFLLTEGQIRINDVIKIGELSGSVEMLTMRTTVLRAYDGTAHVFSNGAIQNFSNLTMGHSYCVFDVAVEFEDDPERLMALFAEVGEELRAEPEWGALVMEPMQVAGVDRFTEQGVVVKARLKTLPSQQWKVGREVLRRLRKHCVERGITIATAQRAVQLFEKGASLDSHPAQPARRP
ncbi:MAG TPA: mechanosensitive ion channel family protein [Paludibaculum sp.]